jgi:hypothetical protein
VLNNPTRLEPRPNVGQNTQPQFQNRLQRIVENASPNQSLGSPVAGTGLGIPGSSAGARHPGYGADDAYSRGGRTPAAGGGYGGGSGTGGGGGYGGGTYGGASGFAGLRGSNRGGGYYIPKAKNANDPQELKQELEQVKAAESQAQEESSRLAGLVELISSSNPLAMPEPVKSDARYSRLKQSYEDALLNETGDAETQKVTGQALKRLHTWIEKIYRPELEGSSKLADRTRNELNQRITTLKAALKPAEELESIRYIKGILFLLDGAKSQWALENAKAAGEIPTAEAVGLYLRGGFPKAIAGEVYSLNPLRQSVSAKLTKPLADLPAGTVLTSEGPIEQKPTAKP